MIGPFVDETDGYTPETGLTIDNTDIKLLKNGGASVNKNSGGATHQIQGGYALTFDDTDTGTVGELYVTIDVAGARVVVAVYYVLTAAVYDALFDAGAPGFASAAVCTEARLAELDAANVPASTDAAVTGIAGLNNLSAAQVNAEVKDVIDTDVTTLPGQEAPPLQPTLRQAIAWLYKVLRNRKTTTSTLWSLYDDSGGVVDAKADISEAGGTTEKAEIVSGA